MAKYGVDYSCGHHGVIQLYGKIAERERRIGWLESMGKCDDCYRACKIAEREAASRLAAEANAANGLPALVGSDKQIAWAESIRAKALTDVHNQINAEADAKLTTVPEAQRPKYAAVLAAMRAARAELENQASAKWWIDHRHDMFALDTYVRDAGIRADKSYAEVSHAAA